MSVKLRFAAPFVLVSMLTVPAMAQSVSAPTPTVPVAPAPAPAPSSVATPAPAPGCELHIWPAARVAAITQGAGASFGLIGGLIDASAHADQNKRDKAFITSALDATAQAKALKAINLPTLLNLPPVTVVSHDQGLDLKSDEPKRLAASSSACYYDVIVQTILYLKTATTHGKMRTFMAVRRYDGDKNTLDYKDSANHALEVTLPKEGEDTGPATDALISAFKADVTEYSEKFVRKTSKNK